MLGKVTIMKLEVKTTLDLHFTYKDFVSAQGKSRREFGRKKWVSVESITENLKDILENVKGCDIDTSIIFDLIQEIEKQ